MFKLLIVLYYQFKEYISSRTCRKHRPKIRNLGEISNFFCPENKPPIQLSSFSDCYFYEFLINLLQQQRTDWMICCLFIWQNNISNHFLIINVI